MNIDQIKNASRLVNEMEAKEKQIKELDKVEGIDRIEIRKHQSGAAEYSYEVVYRGDFEFMMNIKAQIRAKLQREIDLIKNDLDLL